MCDPKVDCSCFQCPIVGDKIDHQISTWTNISSWSKAWGKKIYILQVLLVILVLIIIIKKSSPYNHHHTNIIIQSSSYNHHHHHHHIHPSSWNINPKMVKSFNGSELHHQFLHMFSLQIQKQQHVSPKSSQSLVNRRRRMDSMGQFVNICLFGGVNPFEKYARQNGSFLQFSGWKWSKNETTTYLSIWVFPEMVVPPISTPSADHF